MKLTYVVAPAANSVEIILMAFISHSDAVFYLTGLGLVANERGDYDKAMLNGELMPLYKALDFVNEEGELVPEARMLRHGLFAKGHYYGGCGECDVIELKTMSEGVPVVAFDLD